MADHFSLGFEVIHSLLEVDAGKSQGISLALPYQNVADACLAWEQAIAAEAPPAGLDTDLDTELAGHANIHNLYAAWCTLAMSDPATAQAQEPDLELPDQTETDAANALDAAYAARDTAANYLGI